MKQIVSLIQRLMCFVLFLITVTLQAQVGINTTNPESALDIRSSSQFAPTNIDGMLIPTIDAFPETSPTNSQDGMLVFFTGNTIQAKGFYYWADTLGIWVFYGGVNRIHQLNDGMSNFVSTTDTGSNIVLGEFEALFTQYSDTYPNFMVSHNTAVGYKSIITSESYSHATAVGYNAVTSIDRPLFIEESTVFGYHDINENTDNQIVSNNFAHLIKNGYSNSFAIGSAYGNSTFDIWQTPGTWLDEGETETYIGSYFGYIFDVWSDSGMLYWSRITTLGFGYETLPVEPLNSSKLFYDSGNDILQCRAKDVLRGIHHDVGNGVSNRFRKSTISLGYRQLYGYDPLPLILPELNYQNINIGYLAHDNSGPMNNDPDNPINWNNIAIGTNTLYASSDTNNNLAIGENALQLNESHNNIAIGKEAMSQHSIGDDNIALGDDVLYNNVLGANNVALGSASGYNVFGSENVFLGDHTAHGLSTHFKSGGVNIGAFSGYLDTNFNRLYIEATSGTTPLIGGDFNLDRVGINRNINSLTNTLEVGGTASKNAPGDWLANSDKRLKKEIHSISGLTALSRLTNLHGVSYFWNDTQTGNQRPEGVQYGFIAQDLMQEFPEHVTKDNQGFYQTAYGTYDAFYVEAIKELQAKFNKNDESIDNLDARLKRIENILRKSKKFEL